MLLCSGTTLAKHNPSSWCWETCSPCPGYIDRSAIEQVPACASSHAARWLILARAFISGLSTPALVRLVDSQWEWLSGELRSSHAACGEPCAGRANDGKRGEEKKDWRQAETGLSGTIHFSAVCEDQPLPCFTLNWEMEGGLPFFCHWLSKHDTGRKIQR